MKISTLSRQMQRWSTAMRTGKRSSKWGSRPSRRRPNSAEVTSAWTLLSSTRSRCLYLIISTAASAESTTRTISNTLSQRSTTANSSFTKISTTLLTESSTTSTYEVPLKSGRPAPSVRRLWLIRSTNFALSNTRRIRAAARSKMPLSQTLARQLLPPQISWVSLTLSIRGSRALSTSAPTKETTTLLKKIHLMTRMMKIFYFPKRTWRWKSLFKKLLGKMNRKNCNSMCHRPRTIGLNSTKTSLRNRERTQWKRIR